MSAWQDATVRMCCGVKVMRCKGDAVCNFRYLNAVQRITLRDGRGVGVAALQSLI